MKDIEQYVTSLVLSQELKKAGIKQESIWFWTNGDYLEHMGWSNVAKYEWNDKKGVLYPVKRNTTKFSLMLGSPADMDRYGKPDPKHIKWFSAFTCGELGEMLPIRYLSGRSKVGWNCWRFSKEWLIDDYNSYCSKTEAEARGKMWLHLKQNGK